MKVFMILALSFLSISSFGQKTNPEVEKVKSDNLLLTSKIQTLEVKYELLKSEIENLKMQLAAFQSKSNNIPLINKPDTLISSLKQTNSEAIQTNKTSSSSQYSSSNYGQCRATTKKGARCSRSAKSNGYCWQHGG